MSVPKLAGDLRKALVAAAEPERAAAMQAYMKSAMPFRGIGAPLRRRLTAEAVKAHPCANTDELAATMRVLWREARFREERYAAAFSDMKAIRTMMPPQNGTQPSRAPMPAPRSNPLTRVPPSKVRTALRAQAIAVQPRISPGVNPSARAQPVATAAKA